MAVLQRGREPRGLLPAVAEDEHLAALVRQPFVELLRRLLGELGVDQCGEGLFALGAKVVMRPRAGAGGLAHRAAGELGSRAPPLARRRRRGFGLESGNSAFAVQVARGQVDAHSSAYCRVPRADGKQLDPRQIALGLPPEELQPRQTVRTRRRPAGTGCRSSGRRRVSNTRAPQASHESAAPRTTSRATARLAGRPAVPDSSG